jgi:formylglycine-generating enzyme required for sulfatase activity
MTDFLAGSSARDPRNLSSQDYGRTESEPLLSESGLEGERERGARPRTEDALGSERTLAERLRATRRLTEQLAAPLSAEDQTVQSMPDVSPTKWHRAHTTWFFETFVLSRFEKAYKPFDPSFAFLFNSYYEAAGPRHQRAARGLVSRPGIREIAQYRAHVDQTLERLLESSKLDSWTFPGWDLDFQSKNTSGDANDLGGNEADLLKAALVELGIQHEQQHQELILMDIKHVLWTNPVGPAYMSREHERGSCPADDAGRSHEHASEPWLSDDGWPWSTDGGWSWLADDGGRSHAHKDGPWLTHEGGLVEIGHSGPGFAFDNESPRHEVFLRPFALASRLVTNEDWLEFINDGGYDRPELWLSDGWATVQSQGWRAPLYWATELPDFVQRSPGVSPRDLSTQGIRERGVRGRAVRERPVPVSHREASQEDWMEFTLWGWRPLDLEAPVCHVSYYEADAFATWSGARLPTEAEWEAVAERVLLDLGPTTQAKPLQAATRGLSGFPGARYSSQYHTGLPGNWLDLSVLCPVAPSGDLDTQLFGDVWEWTSSAYLPYPGYRRPVGAIGEYNGKFMVSQHVLKGGSCATPAGHARISYRNFFPPWSRWAFSGVRLARDL